MFFFFFFAAAGIHTIWSGPQGVQFSVQADTATIMAVVRSGEPWPGVPVLVATTGPARVQAVVPEAGTRIWAPDSVPVAIPAPLASVDGEGYLRNQHVTRVVVQHVQRVRTGWVIYPKVVVTVTFPPPSGRAPVDPLVARILSQVAVNGPVGGRPRSQGTRLIPPPSPSCKIVVDQQGLYQVTGAQLEAAGAPVTGVPSHTLRLWYHGLEQAFLVRDGGDGRFDSQDTLIFFGTARRRENPAGREVPYVSEYGRAATYWLSWGQGSGLRWREVNAAPQPQDPQAPWYWHWEHAETESLIFIATHNEPFNNQIEWYWARLAANPGLYQFAVQVDQVAPADSFVLRIGLQGGSESPGHHSQFFVSGVQVGEAWWGLTWGREALVFDSADSGLALSVALLRSPSTLVGIKELPDGQSGSAAYSFLNWIEVRYPRRHVARNGTLEFGGPPGQPGRFLFRVANAQGPRVFVVNLSRGEWLGGVVCAGDTASFSATASESDALWLSVFPPATPLAIIPFQELSPALDSPQWGADYLVVAHPSLLPAAAGLTQWAGGQGLRTATMNVSQLYDYFSWGEVHPTGVRDFLVCAFEHWEPPAPSHLVLLGDACWDFLGVTPNAAPNLVPTWGNPGSDAYFARLTYDEQGVYDWIPDIAVGRLPARTLDEAWRMVSALTAAQTPSCRITWVAHGANTWEHQSFAWLSNSVKSVVPQDLLARHLTVYADADEAESPRWYKEEFVASWRQDPLVVHFMGRGDFYTWCMEHHVSLADTLGTTGTLPLVLGGSCHSGRFAMPDSSCLAEVVLRAQAPAGCLGFVSSTGITSITQAYYWSYVAVPMLLANPPFRVGEAFLAGTLMGGDFLAQRYVLLGDPAVRIPRPVLPNLTFPQGWLTLDPANPCEGEEVSLGVRAVNEGSVGNVDSCWVTLVDSSLTGVREIARVRVALPAQAETILTLPWIPSVRGTHWIKATLDDQGVCEEWNETDNTAWSTVSVAFPPPQPLSPGPCALLRTPPQLVVATLPDEPDVTYRFQVATSPSFGPGQVVVDLSSLSPGEYATVCTPPPLPHRTPLVWRARAEHSGGPGLWSSIRSFEIDPQALGGGWRQGHWGQFLADSLQQCVVDTVASAVRLQWTLGPDVATTSAGASVVWVSSAYPGFSPQALVSPGQFIFGNEDLDQTALIDLGSTRLVGAVGTVVWSGPMDRGVWSLLELSLSEDGTTFQPVMSFGPYPFPHLEIPARTLQVVDPAVPARYVRARFGAGCPRPGAIWGSRVYEVRVFPREQAPQGWVLSPVVGPASHWMGCEVQATCPQDTWVRVSVEGYSLQTLSWESLPGLENLQAPGSWPMASVDPAVYPMVRLRAELARWSVPEPALTRWTVYYTPR